MSPEEKRTMSTTTDAQGGWTVAESFANDVLQSESQTDEVNQAATLIVTAKGNPFNYPVLDTATATAIATAQNAQTATSAPLVFDQIAFGECPTARVDDIVAPRELVEDSASPMERIVAVEGRARLARYGGAAAVAAIVAACDVGTTTAATGAITADEILDLIASVDEKYAANGAFLMATSTMIALRKLKSTSGGSYLLPFGKDAGGRKTLFDFPIHICPEHGYFDRCWKQARGIRFAGPRTETRRQEQPDAPGFAGEIRYSGWSNRLCHAAENGFQSRC